MMEQGKVHRLSRVIFSVLRIILPKKGYFTKRMKCFKPTHLLPKTPLVGL